MLGELLGGIGAIGSAIGGFFGGTESAKSSAEASKANTRAQLNWERERALNGHQWEIQDLEKAGLNKVLTANGAGATTGSINPQMPDTTGIRSSYEGLFSGLAGMINSVQQIQKTQKEIQNIQAQTENLDKDSELKKFQAIAESLRKGLITAQTAKILSENELTKFDLRTKKKWTDWEKGSEIFKNIAMPLTSVIGLYGFSKKFKELLKAQNTIRRPDFMDINGRDFFKLDMRNLKKI